MSQIPDQKARRLLPRWRTFQDASRTRELRSFGVPIDRNDMGEEFLQNKMDEWRSGPTIAIAVDILTTAIAQGKSREFEHIGWWLINKKEQIAPAILELARATALPLQGGRFGVGGQGLISAKETIATLRKTLRTNLHDPISFVDLARAHVLVGNLVAARRAAQIAIGLAPDNRFVLRSLSRFWIHDGDVERAHYALLRSDRTRIDPWLMAAEISVASVGGKSPRTVREGRRTIDSKDRSPGQLSELAGALGTLETLSGKRKLARDMFTFSVTDPTENALAQAVWAERVGIPVEIPSDRLSKSHEALTWRARAVGEWGLAIEACWKWLEQEPFSKIPATLGSFMCSIVERYEDASRFADLGIEANDKDVVLQNNFAFAEISMNKLHSGLMALRKAHLMAQTPHEKRLVSATSALSYFRRGIASSGREIYRRVINEALQGNEHSTVAIASAFWAKAEIDVGEGFEKEPIGIFMKASRSSMEPEIRFFKGQFLEIK